MSQNIIRLQLNVKYHKVSNIMIPIYLDELLNQLYQTYIS
jgi:hypothetical protein